MRCSAWCVLWRPTSAVPRRPRVSRTPPRYHASASPRSHQSSVAPPVLCASDAAAAAEQASSLPTSSTESNGVPASSAQISAAPPASSTCEDVVVLEDVTVSFEKKRVLNRLNLRLRSGEGTAIIGASGTGKSTTLRVMCGLQVPDSGAVYVRNWRRTQHISKQPSPEKLALVFQNGALFDSMTVLDNVGFELFHHSTLPRARIVELVREALQRVGLGDILELYPMQLSGGMQRRVSFARATIYDPDDASTMPRILLYDEPTAGLDPTASTRVENCIRSIQRSVCDTYAVVTHNLSTIRRTADRVVFLHNGTIVWDGPTHEVDTTPNAYVRQFMEARLDGPLDDSEEWEAETDNVGQV